MSTFILLDRPLPPSGKPAVTEASVDCCRLQWQPSPDDGGAVITSYIVEKREVPDGRWRRVGTSSVTHMVVCRLRENAKYRFRVMAENMYGLSEAGEESDDVTLCTDESDLNYDAFGKLDL